MDGHIGSKLDHGILTDVVLVNKQEQNKITSLYDRSQMDSNCIKKVETKVRP